MHPFIPNQKKYLQRKETVSQAHILSLKRTYAGSCARATRISDAEGLNLTFSDIKKLFATYFIRP